jgi:hypothetical protein
LHRISSCSDLRSDCFTSDLVQIDVGPEDNRRTFRVHEKALCHYSGYFAGAMRGKFVEAETKRITLATEDPDIFSMFIYWLYRGRIPPPAEASHHAWETVMKLWVFGDVRTVRLLQNDTMDLLLRTAVESNQVPTICIPYIYSNTMPDSPLRRVMIDMVSRCMDKPELSNKTKWTREPLLDLANAIWNGREEVELDDLIANGYYVVETHDKSAY